MGRPRPRASRRPSATLGPLHWNCKRFLAALVARLAFVAELARRLPAATAALVARLTFVAKLTGWLIGKGWACSAQHKQTGQQQYRRFALHLLPPCRRSGAGPDRFQLDLQRLSRALSLTSLRNGPVFGDGDGRSPTPTVGRSKAVSIGKQARRLARETCFHGTPHLRRSTTPSRDAHSMRLGDGASQAEFVSLPCAAASHVGRWHECAWVGS
jgi:hypothetical protein